MVRTECGDDTADAVVGKLTEFRTDAVREVKRRLKVVGTFPNVESALMLATARLKWTQESTWSQKRYLGMSEDQGEAVA